MKTCVDTRTCTQILTTKRWKHPSHPDGPRPGMRKQTAVQPRDGTRHIDKNEQSAGVRNNTDEPRTHWVCFHVQDVAGEA